MAVPTEDQFRQDFPEFADAAKYTPDMFTFWMTVAAAMLNASKWNPATLYNLGLELFVAHNLVLEAQSLATASVGGIPGLSTGALSAKAVDKVSASYDTAAGLELDGGHWNLTVYGTRFLRMARMMGAGPVQVND